MKFVTYFFHSLDTALDMRFHFTSGYHLEANRQAERTNQTLEQYCHNLAKWLSQYFFFFFFSFIFGLLFFFYIFFSLFSHQWMHERKVTHREAWDKKEGLGLLFIYKQCIKSNRNSIKFSLLNAEQRAVSLILAWSLVSLQIPPHILQLPTEHLV